VARVYPFQPFRYTEKAGSPERLLTQPYDKISPAMRSRYQSLSPYNLVQIILGEPKPSDSDTDNVYTRAGSHLNEWIASGILARDDQPAVFPYFQEFTVPDTGERLTREGFIALGAVEDYAAGVVYRHEQTLSGPKQDRLQLLRHTHAHFGQIFMLYSDPARTIDELLDESARGRPITEATDEYGAIHRMWRISDAGRIQQLIADKKLLIADGHHRYETALAFRRENPGLAGSDRVMMTFVNLYSPGLKILATHRLVSGVNAATFPQSAAIHFHIEEIDSPALLLRAWREKPDRTIIGAAMGARLYLMKAREPRGALDVRVLHERLLGDALNIREDAVRDEKHLRYIRGIDSALAEARTGSAQIAFLLKPTSIQQVADVAFGGGVMPQKSTDFYPKLLSGLAIYRLG